MTLVNVNFKNQFEQTFKIAGTELRWLPERSCIIEQMHLFNIDIWNQYIYLTHTKHHTSMLTKLRSNDELN